METLEEAAENYNLNTINAFGDYESFIAGAKWQQERIYSEEEFKEMVYHMVGGLAQANNITFNGAILDELFNKFKKK